MAGGGGKFLLLTCMRLRNISTIPFMTIALNLPTSGHMLIYSTKIREEK